MGRVVYYNLGWFLLEAWERSTWREFWDLAVSSVQARAWNNCEYLIVSGVWEVRYAQGQ